MSALWAGVLTGQADQAYPAFFPEAAYLQLKSLPSDATDFTNRLLAEFDGDVAAAHELLGPAPVSPTLVGVEVPGQFAHWVPPGVCDNLVGYFEVANSRVVYMVDGQERSFGIASMISWRGQWYVVHLGAILRSGSGGEVDDPEIGPGSPAYSGTC
jgi:hypothetical protein